MSKPQRLQEGLALAGLSVFFSTKSLPVVIQTAFSNSHEVFVYTALPAQIHFGDLHGIYSRCGLGLDNRFPERLCNGPF